MKKNYTTDDIEIDEIPLEEKKKIRKASKKAKIPQQQEPPMDRKTKNRELVGVSYFIVTMFLSLAVYLVYFNFTKTENINSITYNTKQESKEKQIIRGHIYSIDGEILAGTNVNAEDGSETRVYPLNNIFSHVVGYASNGKSGVEATSGYDLLSSHASILDQLENEDEDIKVRGDSVVLTLDSKLQRAVYDALGDYKGAIVVMEPSTGKILAMVSKPDFNPNTINEDWDALISDTTNSSLFNRAAQGQYPPGSTFKILTTLAYMRQHPDDYMNYSYTCQGSISREDVTITCYGGSVHGTVNLEEAFTHSCNGAFANIGMELDNSSFISLCEDFSFNSELPIDMASSKSLFRLDANASYGEEMMTAIGQGDTLVSPLEMAMITSAMANGGIMMKPYYVDHIETYDGASVKQYKPSKYKEVMTAEEAAVISDLMTKTVESGTASALSGFGYTVAGKTGSAEFEINENYKGTHSWFVGFSNVNNPDIVISVIAEEGGSGSSVAVPIAQKVFDAYYNGY